MRGTTLLLCAAAVGMACGDDDGPEPTSVRPEVVAPSTETSVEPGAETQVPEAAAEQGPLVDLLTSAPTLVTVSSAYEDDASQARRLADGDLTTAWNSKSGDLEGAWIRIEVPEDAEVSFIQMTVGYTKPGGRSDLFTGNHRISQVRITRDGEPVGSPMLDVTNRGLQTLSIEGKGGTYQIEIIAVVPGSRSDWREICVSELKVMGRSPSARPGSRQPEFLIGAPAGEPEGTAEGDLDALETPEEPEDAMYAAMAGALDKALEYDRLLITGDMGIEPLSSDELQSRSEIRRSMFTQVAVALATIDPEASARMRRVAEEPSPDWSWAARKDDFLLLTTTVDRGFERSGVTGEARCLWARDNISHWSDRMEMIAEQVAEALEREAAPYFDSDHEGAFEQGERLSAEAETFQVFVEALGQAIALWDDTPERGAAAIRAIEVPSHPQLQPEWATTITRIEATRAACSW